MLGRLTCRQTFQGAERPDPRAAPLAVTSQRSLRPCGWEFLRAESAVSLLLQLCWTAVVETGACERFCFKGMSSCYFIGQSGTVNDLYAHVLGLFSDRWGWSGVTWLWSGFVDLVFPLTSLESSCQLQGSDFNFPALNKSVIYSLHCLITFTMKMLISVDALDGCRIRRGWEDCCWQCLRISTTRL